MKRNIRDSRSGRRGSLCVLSTLLALLLLPPAAGARSPGLERLKEKSAEIEQMKAAVYARFSEALTLHEGLREMLEGYEGEIRERCRRYGISDYREALGVARIGYNLELIRELRAHMALLRRKVTYFEESRQKLEYFSGAIQDDVMILSTVNHMTVETLIENIDRSLAEYTAAVADDLVDAAEAAPEALENTWRRVISR